MFSMAMADMFRGPVPTSAPHVGTVPYSPELGGMRPTNIGRNQSVMYGKEEPVTMHFGLKAHGDQSHLHLRPGQLLFVARHQSTAPNNDQVVVLTAGHLNSVMRQQFSHYLSSLGVGPAALLGGAEFNQPLLHGDGGYEVGTIDHIGNTGTRRHNADALDGRVDLQRAISKGDIAQVREIATAGDEDGAFVADSTDAYYTPSPQRIYQLRKRQFLPPLFMAAPGAEPRALGPAADAARPSARVALALADLRLAAGGDEATLQELEERAAQMGAREAARRWLDEAYRDRMYLHGRYVSRYEILDFWSFLGAVHNTNYGRDAVTEGSRAFHPHPRVNVALERKIQIENVWADRLRTGQTLYLILRREAYDDGSYGPFQLAPWHGAAGERPAASDLAYTNIAGEAEMGALFFVGTVFNDTEGASPASARRDALCLSDDITWQQAEVEAAKLELVTVQLKRR